MRIKLVLLMITLAIAGCTVGDPDDAGPSDEALMDDSDNPPPLEIESGNHVKTAFEYFRDKGLTRVQSAAIVGNLMQESSVNPTAVQYGGGPGRGIAQWSVGGRWNSSSHDNVAWYASVHGVSRWSLTTQLNFIWYELTHFSYGLPALKSATTLTGAVKAFQDRYEICGACNTANRVHDAQYVLSHY